MLDQKKGNFRETGGKGSSCVGHQISWRGDQHGTWRPSTAINKGRKKEREEEGQEDRAWENGQQHLPNLVKIDEERKSRHATIHNYTRGK